MTKSAPNVIIFGGGKGFVFSYQIRLTFLDRPSIVMVLEERQEDLLLLAWVVFEDQGRDALHDPVSSKNIFNNINRENKRWP